MAGVVVDREAVVVPEVLVVAVAVDPLRSCCPILREPSLRIVRCLPLAVAVAVAVAVAEMVEAVETAEAVLLAAAVAMEATAATAVAADAAATVVAVRAVLP